METVRRNDNGSINYEPEDYDISLEELVEEKVDEARELLEVANRIIYDRDNISTDDYKRLSNFVVGCYVDLKQKLEEGE